MARRLKLTPDLMARAAHLVADGHYLKTVAELLDVDESTFHRWLREGEEAKGGIKRQFYQSITRASAKAEQEAVVAWKQAFEKDWRAALAFLERRFPDRWARRELLPPEQPPVKITMWCQDCDRPRSEHRSHPESVSEETEVESLRGG